MSDGSGPQSRTPFAWFDQESSCWKTSVPSFDLGEMGTDAGEQHQSKQSLVTWPDSGMTVGGRAYELPTSGDATNGSGGSASRSTQPDSNGGGLTLFPTPTAGNFNDGQDPTDWEMKRRALAAKYGNNGAGIQVPQVVARLVAGWESPSTGESTNPRSGDTNESLGDQSRLL